MADIRATARGATLVPQAGVAPTRGETVRAAQRAFFEAALNGATVPPAAPQPRAAASTATPVAGATPGRMLRPGSLVDIKV